MKQKRRVVALLAAAVSVVPVAGCSDTDGGRPGASAPPSSLVLVDADTHGYLTFDTDREVLRGHTRDGKQVWEEKGYFPADVQCATACPDAAISATADMNRSASGTHVIWKHGGTSTTRSFRDDSLVVQWARNKDTWVATSESAVIWSDHGRTRTKPFTKGIEDSMGRVSEDGSTLVISVQQNGGTSWSAFRFPLTGNRLSPSPLSVDLPGSVGCLSPENGTMWTLGNRASEFDLVTGKKIRETEQFASDCASSGTSTMLGAFSAQSDGSTQDISITSGSRLAPFEKISVRSAGEIGLFQDCGVLLSDGRLTSFSAGGRADETEISAHSVLTVPDGHLYSIGPSGEVEQHTVTATGGSCRIG
ncbi:hypothetical protein [Streptomyces sp. NPDC093094]|uniref:hypothetical protein n=1 Tax=Streptomyces sp. NPDC093094 TaxID=3366026 RepID=UPI00381222AF